MDNLGKLTTLGTQDTGQNKRCRKPKAWKGQSRMDNPEILPTLGTLDTGRNKRYRKPKGQSRMDNP